MSIALLDINDSNLQMWHGSSHLQSPGYALLVDKQYRFGNPARAAARLQPRDINTRFWWQLSTEALQPALGPVMAVSGSMQRDQLALLLGIVQQCPFAAVGLVNRSVAIGSLYGASGRLFHLEVQLHQSVICELVQNNGEVQLQRTLPLPGTGLLQVQERLVEIISTAFIRQTRFDPRRKALTEQHLYDALPDALRALGRESETNIEVNGYRARINRADLQDAGTRLFESARDAMGSLKPQDRVIADPIAGLLPGLAERLPGLELLAADSVRSALEQQLDGLVQRDQALSFVTALPSLATITAAPDIAPEPRPEVVAAPTAPAVAAKPAATHLLQGSVAVPLAMAGTTLGQGWEIHRTAVGWQLRGAGAAVLVNDSPLQPDQVLGGGDSLRIGDGPELRLIEVAPQR